MPADRVQYLRLLHEMSGAMVTDEESLIISSHTIERSHDLVGDSGVCAMVARPISLPVLVRRSEMVEHLILSRTDHRRDAWTVAGDGLSIDSIATDKLHLVVLTAQDSGTVNAEYPMCLPNWATLRTGGVYHQGMAAAVSGIPDGKLDAKLARRIINVHQVIAGHRRAALYAEGTRNLPGLDEIRNLIRVGTLLDRAYGEAVASERVLRL